MEYDEETLLVQVKHETVADRFGHSSEVKKLVLELELAEEGMRWSSPEFDSVRDHRHKLWRKRVQGRTWTAVCANDWNMWPIAKIEANATLYRLY